jgi:K(+)-stimulated pyrophosphate-energized sodium pump
MGADLFGSYVATVLAAMLGNYVIKIWEVVMTLAELDLFYYQWLLQVLILFSIIGTLLVKITDDNAKEAQVQKSIKYRKLCLLTAIGLLFQ